MASLAVTFREAWPTTFPQPSGHCFPLAIYKAGSNILHGRPKPCKAFCGLPRPCNAFQDAPEPSQSPRKAVANWAEPRESRRDLRRPRNKFGRVFEHHSRGLPSSCARLTTAMLWNSCLHGAPACGVWGPLAPVCKDLLPSRSSCLHGAPPHYRTACGAPPHCSGVVGTCTSCGTTPANGVWSAARASGRRG